MLENLITPEFLAQKEGITVEEARQARQLSGNMVKEMNTTVNENLDNDNTDDTSKQVTNIVNNFVAGLTGKTPAELSKTANQTTSEE